MMERLKVVSEVNMFGFICKHEHEMEFNDDENVFARVLKYHEYMHKTFPNKEWRLVKTELISKS